MVWGKQQRETVVEYMLYIVASIVTGRAIGLGPLVTVLPILPHVIYTVQGDLESFKLCRVQIKIYAMV